MSVPVIKVGCPTCNAQPWQVCTRPSNTGRVPITYFHAKRSDLADETVDPDPVVLPSESVAEALVTALKNDPTVSFIACDCGHDLEVYSELTLAEVRSLIEHAAHAHTGRRDVHVYRSTLLLSGNELGLLLRLNPLTDAEQKWREEHPTPGA